MYAIRSYYGVYVERPLFERFVSALKQKAEAVKFGHPLDKNSNYGPLISREHREKVLSYYRKAVEEGATVVTGGGIPEMPAELAEGNWIQPTIWTGLADDAACVRVITSYSIHYTKLYEVVRVERLAVA